MAGLGNESQIPNAVLILLLHLVSKLSSILFLLGIEERECIRERQRQKEMEEEGGKEETGRMNKSIDK